MTAGIFSWDLCYFASDMVAIGDLFKMGGEGVKTLKSSWGTPPACFPTTYKFPSAAKVIPPACGIDQAAVDIELLKIGAAPVKSTSIIVCDDSLMRKRLVESRGNAATSARSPTGKVSTFLVQI